MSSGQTLGVPGNADCPVGFYATPVREGEIALVRFHFEWVNTQNMKILEYPISNTEYPISKEIIAIFPFSRIYAFE
jgi:hypothetical protein